MPDTRSTVLPIAGRASSAACLLLILAVGAASCSRGRSAMPSDDGAAGRSRGQAGEPVVVTTAAAVQKPMAVNVRAVGNVEPSAYVDVRSQVTGELLTVDFVEGQDVEAGQRLFTIDPRPFAVALQRAEAQLARDAAQAKGAELQLRRSTDLLGRGLVSQADNDTTATEVASLQALVQVDKAQVESAKLQLDYTTIVAPVSGRTGALLVHRGSLVRAADASPLVVINQVTPAFVTFAVPARLFSRIRAEQAHGGLTVHAAPTGDSTAPATGTVTFIDNAVDQATDTIRLKASFPNSSRRLWPGAFADVTLQLSVDPTAIVIPDAAVQNSQQGQFVYVMNPDHTVAAHPITLAWSDAGESVIATGVKAGDIVVTDGQLRLTDGAHVDVAPGAGGAQAVAP